jgi:sugar phosphate isomerase/epimerase
MDVFYATEGKKLGREVKVGEGMANIPEVVKRLKAAGYKGNYIIEREISGEQQIKDIIDTIAFLRGII